MKRLTLWYSLCLLAGPAAAKKPVVLQPARPFADAAADFYPEVRKQYDFCRRWADRAEGDEVDSCRARYHRAVREAFAAYRTGRRRELAQTAWPVVLELACPGNGPRTCTQEFTAPTGQEWDTAGLRGTGRPLSSRPTLSPDRRRLAAALQKRGEGTALARILLRSRREAGAIEQQIDGEQIALRRKLELHGLPSDATLDRYPLR